MSKLAYLALCRSIHLLVPAGPWRRRQGLGDPGAPPPTHRARRQVARPRLQPADRALLAAFSRARWSCFLSSPRRCCAGTATSSRAPGPTHTTQQGDRSSTKSCTSSSFGWPARTRTGATSASRGSCSGSACASLRPRSAPHYAAAGWIWRRGHRSPPGGVPTPVGRRDHCLRLLYRRYHLYLPVRHPSRRRSMAGGLCD